MAKAHPPENGPSVQGPPFPITFYLSWRKKEGQSPISFVPSESDSRVAFNIGYPTTFALMNRKRCLFYTGDPRPFWPGLIADSGHVEFAAVFARLKASVKLSIFHRGTCGKGSKQGELLASRKMRSHYIRADNGELASVKKRNNLQKSTSKMHHHFVPTADINAGV
ncbi:MAG: hypothetical protein DWI28_01350 [Planctomycetota bacterium]|nr:MAG: hypothetical protein DWI28_01350 [Planctomycetota bacterium]